MGKESVAMLFIVLIIILACCTGPKWKTGNTENTENATEAAVTSLEDFELDSEYKQDEVVDVTTLITNYLNAYADNDIGTLKKYATPISENESGYIAVLSEYIESYENVSCYTMAGLTEGSYLVSAYYDIKFVDVKATAPTLDFFYVETNEDGELFINNLYSNYNYNHRENSLDATVDELIQLFQQHVDVVALRSEVTTKYNEAVAADEDLNKMITSTLPAAISVWAESVVEE